LTSTVITRLIRGISFLLKCGFLCFLNVLAVTIEAVDIERQKSAGQLEDESLTPPHSPIADFIVKIDLLLEKKG
jgi:hypothetical protein